MLGLHNSGPIVYLCGELQNQGKIILGQVGSKEDAVRKDGHGIGNNYSPT